jgi:hypothetical protein
VSRTPSVSVARGVNPYQILVIELDKTTTVAAIYRRILLMLGDEHWNDRRSKLDDLEEHPIIARRGSTFYCHTVRTRWSGSSTLVRTAAR